MGIISKGILGGFSGTVGNVVGGNWKGIDYMRSQSSKRTTANTPAQLSQQAKFAVAIKFVRSMSGLLMISFRNNAIQMTGINNALSYTLKNAITGVYPAYSIDYSTALVTRGDLPNVVSPTAVASAASIVTFNWTDNTGLGKAKATDKAMLVVYCPSLNQSVYTTGSAARSAGTDAITASHFKGLAVETFIGFISDDGKDITNSIYTGSVTVL